MPGLLAATSGLDLHASDERAHARGRDRRQESDLYGSAAIAGKGHTHFPWPGLPSNGNSRSLGWTERVSDPRRPIAARTSAGRSSLRPWRRHPRCWRPEGKPSGGNRRVPARRRARRRRGEDPLRHPTPRFGRSTASPPGN